MERCPRSGHTRCRTNSVSYSGSMERLPNLKGGPSSLRHSVGKFIETVSLMFSKLLVLDVLIVLFSNVVCMPRTLWYQTSGVRAPLDVKCIRSMYADIIDVCIYYYCMHILLMYADIIVCRNIIRINSTADILRNESIKTDILID